MMRKTWRSFALSVLAFLMMFAFPAWPAQAQSLPDSLAATIGLTDAEREAVYGGMTFPTSGLQVGQVLAVKPLTVVTELGTIDRDGYVAHIRVFTGLVSRVEQDLMVGWDSIWIEDDGKAGIIHVNTFHRIPDYFDAEHQREFRSAEYAGIYPWVDIPTDAEAKVAGLDPLPSDGFIDLYGYAFESEDVDLSSTEHVSLLPAIPPTIGGKPPFPTVVVEQEPADIAGHWAREYILSLMEKGVITGYEDGTIRPNRTLSRAEFVKLMVDAIRQSPNDADTGYNDLSGHWSASYVKAAIDAGIVPAGKDGEAFEPDKPISRAEMAVLLDRSLSELIVLEVREAPTFSDVAALSEQQQAAIETAASYGLISGFTDGSFRPDDSLTRAQGFTVISKLIDMQ